jgi:hypothetical protein
MLAPDLAAPKMGKLAVFDEKFERLGRPDYSR